MKVKSLIFSAAVALTATAAVAQSVEYDDMYFNGKDRQKLKDQQAKEAAALSQTPASKHNKSSASSEVYADNGSYSARNQNPEFTARTNSKAAAEDAEYFSSDYRYNNAAQVQSFNKNYSDWYSSPWVANNYYGSSIYDWNTPYYGSTYDSWGNPWMNPYYQSGWSTSFSFAMGNSWNYGSSSAMRMGMGMGMGYGCPYSNPYNNSWSSWGMSYGAGYGYGGGGGYYGGGGYGYPTVVVVNDARSYSYGKRASQNGMITSRQSAANVRARQTAVATDPNATNVARPTYNAGGRVATTPTTTSNVSAPSRGTAQRQDDYYNRNWRTVRPTQTYGGGSSTYTQPTRSSQSSGWDNNSSQTQWQRSSGSDNGRSGYSGTTNNGSGVTRSAAPASSGSGGRTRGRD